MSRFWWLPLALALLAPPCSSSCLAFLGTPSGLPRISKRTANTILMVDEGLKGQARLENFLRDCELLGPCRFVVGTGEGKAILETVAAFETLSFRDNPEKGRFVTLSADGNDFEAHLNCEAVKGIEMTERLAKDGTHQLYLTRFLDEGGASLMTMMLHQGPNGYEEGSVQYWEKLRKAFGEKQDLRE